MSTANLPAFDTLETYTQRFSEFRLGHSELQPDLRHYCRWICGHPSRLSLTVFNFNRFSERLGEFSESVRFYSPFNCATSFESTSNSSAVKSVFNAFELANNRYNVYRS